MKSLVVLVNTTAAPIVRFGVTFSPGVPVVVYRSRKLLVPGEDLGRLFSDLSSSSLVGFDFAGTPNSADQSIETFNTLANEYAASLASPGYSPLLDWFRLCSADLLDGMRRQLLSFDWSDPGVAVDLDDTLAKLSPVVAYLSAGFLDLATSLVDNCVPDGPNDFLSETRLASYASLFHSAAEE